MREVHTVEGRMFIRAPIEFSDAQCFGCAAFTDMVCFDLPACHGDKPSIFKEVVFKGKNYA